MFEAFQVGPFLIWTHLLFLLLGVWMATEFFLRLSQSAGLSLQHFKDRVWWHLGAFLLFGRLVAMLAEYRVYLRTPLRVLIVWDGNFSFLGGAIGIAAVLYFTRGSSRTTFLQWLDVLLPAASFGLVFDWIGRFTAGQAYGRPTDAFWGVTYDAINVRFAVPIHPVQLYYAFFYLILTFLLLVVRKNAKRAGAETLVGIVLAGIATFTFEWFRGDFTIPVIVTKLDFVLLLLLFISLGMFAAFELKLSDRFIMAYLAVTTVLCGLYIVVRLWLPFETFELRFTQYLAILSLLATIVYVIVHRRRYPHL